jgi:uncharacterized phage protein gp47/JayE
MADQLTSAGIEIDDLETRTDDLIAQVRADISPILDCSAGSDMGQFLRIFAERTQSAMELIEAVYYSQYPDTASGFSLTAVSVLTGTQRDEATQSTLLSSQASVQLDAGVTLPQGSVAHVAGDPTSRFTSDVAVNNPAGVPAWVPCAFTSEDTGPIQALSGTLTVIAEPQTGWTGVTNSADATEGENEELDPPLRVRREAELQTGSTATGAILTALTQIEGVIWAAVLENDTDFTDVNGLPPHSVEAVVYAPAVTDADIAEAVYEAKAAGIKANGTTIVLVTNSQGNTQNIGFSRATVDPLYVEIDVTTDPETYDGDAALATAIADWGDTNLGVGDPVILTQIIAEAFEQIEGVVDVTRVEVDTVTPTVATGNYITAWNHLGDLDTGRITVVSI